MTRNKLCNIYQNNYNITITMYYNDESCHKVVINISCHKVVIKLSYILVVIYISCHIY